MIDPITAVVVTGTIVGGVNACYAEKGKKGKAFVEGFCAGATLGVSVSSASNSYAASQSQLSSSTNKGS